MLDSAFLMTLLAISLIGILLWVRCFRLLRATGPAVLYVERETPFGLIDVMLMFFMWVVFPGIITSIPLAVWGFPELKSLSTGQTNLVILLSSSVQLAGCVAAALLLIRKYGAGRDVFGVNTRRLPQHALLAGQAFCMVVPPVLAMQWLLTTWQPYEHDTINQLQDNFSLATVMVTWLGAVIAAPVCEELLFRGLLQGWLQRIRFGLAANNTAAELLGGWNRAEDDPRPVTASPREMECGEAGMPSKGCDAGRPEPVTSTSTTIPVQHLRWWMPIVISSLMFAAIHIGQGLAPIPLFFFGLSLGILYRFSGSVLPSILLHLMLNGFSMFWVTVESILSHIQLID